MIIKISIPKHEWTQESLKVCLFWSEIRWMNIFEENDNKNFLSSRTVWREIGVAQ